MFTLWPSPGESVVKTNDVWARRLAVQQQIWRPPLTFMSEYVAKKLLNTTWKSKPLFRWTPSFKLTQFCGLILCGKIHLAISNVIVCMWREFQAVWNGHIGSVFFPEDYFDVFVCLPCQDIRECCGPQAVLMDLNTTVKEKFNQLRQRIQARPARSMINECVIYQCYFNIIYTFFFTFNI